MLGEKVEKSNLDLLSLARRARPSHAEFLLYHAAQHLSRRKLYKFSIVANPEICAFFLCIVIDFVRGLWYYNYSKREVARLSNEVSDAVGKSQRTTRKSQKNKKKSIDKLNKP